MQRQGDLEKWSHEDMYTWRLRDMYMKIFNEKRKSRRFSLIFLHFAHRSNGSLPFVRLLTSKQTEVIPFANRLNRLAHLCLFYFHTFCEQRPQNDASNTMTPVTKRHQSQNVTSNKTSPKNFTNNKMSPAISNNKLPVIICHQS